MISINGSFFINGLQSIGSALTTLVKNISSFLSKLSCVTNAEGHSSDTQMLFQHQSQPMVPHTKLIANLEQVIKEDKQSQEEAVWYARHNVASIDNLERAIEEDKQSSGAAWYAHYNSIADHSSPIRRTSTSSLSSVQITKPERMIKNDKQAASSAIISSDKLQPLPHPAQLGDPEKLRIALNDFKQNPEMARAKWILAKGA